MKHIFRFILFFIIISSFECNAQKSISDFLARDPFIFPNKETGYYYMPLNAGNDKEIKIYRSKDLITWEDKGVCFQRPDAFWGNQDFWAPDMFHYNNKYYLFVTFSNSTSGHRGTSILESTLPEGPYVPVNNSEPITDPTWQCLDATLYIDESNTPWLIFCREWLEVTDGEIYAQQLSSDLKSRIGKTYKLFSASQAPWTASISSGTSKGFVTDAPFIYRNKKGEMLMFWSSFNKQGKYAIGVARSQTGTVLGPWIQDEQPINNDNGGHAMIFNSFEDVPMMSYHSPNEGDSRIIIKELDRELDGTKITGEIIKEEFNTTKQTEKLGAFNIKNYDSEFSAWDYDIDPNSKLSGKYTAKFILQKSSPNWWALQCRLENIQTNEGDSYVVSFDLQGSRPFKSIFKVEAVMDFSKTIDIEDAGLPHHFSFVTPSANRSGNDAVFLFAFGNISAPNVIYLDNIMINKASSTSLAEKRINKSIQLKGNHIFYNVEGGPIHSEVIITDILGRVLYTSSESIRYSSEIALPQFPGLNIITIKEKNNNKSYSYKTNNCFL